MDAWKVKGGRQGNPGNDSHAAETTDQGWEATNLAGNDAKEEESKHTTGENAGERPPGIDNAYHAQHGDGHDTA